MTESARGLHWAVKESFIGYIRGLEDGAIETFDGCEQREGGFEFPGESAKDGEHLFSGGVRFTGFAGMLDVRLVDPMIEVDGDGARVSALVGPASIAARVTIATIEATEPPRPGRPWTATPKLTFEGVRILGDVYQVGAELAPLTVE
ncbi:HtaA domain-containing protein [Agromyces aerolatus]|uniref:HtaA domain-containing protein n=1 Tax=Agromyces sp. LY-1074 TaxID=3074080 RepID=UPI002865DE93|nr:MULTISPECIES: HtaA domain-containing protein [unclassified Agromyces]MDR5701605.1 HtaA domain-containing protein [Agromyces sp. LY-1074]MDR5706135.1 HtaA domain-containing protein [Agromyces sp. LY-1358]